MRAKQSEERKQKRINSGQQSDYPNSSKLAMSSYNSSMVMRRNKFDGFRPANKLSR